MKVSPEAFKRLQAAVEPLDTPERRARYLAGDFVNADRCKDLNMRYRWDLFWLVDRDAVFKEELKDLNDDHIDTALRRAVPPLRGAQNA